jgi:hypothetical protein
MALDTLNNGDSGLEARTKINAAIAAVNAGTILRGSGTLLGYTDAGSPATPPPSLLVPVSSVPLGVSWSLNANGVTYVFNWYDMDPALGGTWIDTSAFGGDPALAVSAFINALNGVGLDIITAGNPSGNDILIRNEGTGVDANLSIDQPSTGGGNGADAVPPSGEVTEVELIPANGAMTLRPIKAGVYGVDGLNCTVGFALKLGGGYYQIGMDFSAFVTDGEITVQQYYPLWITGVAGASLVARITGDVSNGGSLDCWAIAERV